MFPPFSPRPFQSIYMKIKLALLASLLAATFLSAQTSSVPNLMSYQGRVTDAAGTLIGNTEPVNRKVTFRLYGQPSDGPVLYAESQTVTISGGEFSVLIGNGTGVSGSPGPSTPASPLAALDEVLNAATTPLYLGITVDDGNASTVNAEIAPRQQLVSGAYALRAAVAERVVNGSVTTDMLGTSSVSTANLQAQSVVSSRIANSGIATVNIANSAVTAAKLDTGSIGVWTPSGAHVYRNSNVGIGQNNPGFPLNFANVAGPKISLYGNSGNHFGFGIQSALLEIYTGSYNADVAFGYGTSGALNETMRIKGNGNVGIGTASPSAKLHINQGHAIIQNTGNPYLRLTRGGGSYVDLGLASANGSFSSSALTNDTILRSQQSLHLQSGTGSAAMTINTANNVSVPNSLSAGSLSVANNASVANNLSVANDLSVSGNVSASGSLSSGNLSASHMRGNTLYIRDRSSASARYSQGASLEWNKQNGVGATYLLNQKGGGQGGVIFGELETNGTFTQNAKAEPWGNFVIRGTYHRSSDARLKDDIEDAEPMLDRFMQVRFRRYNRTDRDDSSKEFGVIAQELQTLFPELVAESMDDMLAVSYETLATIASKALQELKVSTDAEIEYLNDELAEKDIRITDLETRLAALEATVTR